ncbi:7,8-dihydro-8-oxoguanine triphosphatase [Tepiditoga spiralis]|uniref:7,8-dihydro-8-oxoguanine triphosphatase n=1 Tax=Tepiditoga spiralis TaxID=2108365 RepID=A0A7G1G346_9BACT|nr:8-oxo-dGTP diphosphatase [Tepiditoga spiralis]BBE30395.1 7,8-dihydro-8-oxoguanine triphosphatase [Tepiditoga spiralis]
MKYTTLCFIKKEDSILMLNREKKVWMGMWNVLGGKGIENEKPEECAIREIYEESGIKVKNISYHGMVTWEHNKIKFIDEPMYIFFSEIDKNYELKTPLKTPEGILDWKKIDWILNKDNIGVIKNIPIFLKDILYENKIFKYHFIWKNNTLKDYSKKACEMN